MQKKFSAKTSRLIDDIDGFRVCGGEKPSTPGDSINILNNEWLFSLTCHSNVFNMWYAIGGVWW